MTEWLRQIFYSLYFWSIIAATWWFFFGAFLRKDFPAWQSFVAKKRMKCKTNTRRRRRRRTTTTTTTTTTCKVQCQLWCQLSTVLVATQCRIKFSSAHVFDCDSVLSRVSIWIRSESSCIPTRIGGNVFAELLKLQFKHLHDMTVQNDCLRSLTPPWQSHSYFRWPQLLDLVHGLWSQVA